MLGFLGKFWWAFDLAAHFRVQYFMVLSFVAVAFWVRRRFRPAIIVLAGTLINGAVLLPAFIAEAPRPSDGGLRIVLMNVNTANEQYDRAVDYVRSTEPDLVVFQEVNDDWMQNLASLRQSYPYVIDVPRSDNFGIAIFSQSQLIDPKVIYAGEAEIPSLAATIQWKGSNLTIFTTHPLPPRSGIHTRLRNEQLRELSRIVRETPGQKILIGDLNVTPWSVYFAQLLRDSGLRDGGRGWGIQPSWPTRPAILWISIDHCLLSPELGLVDRQIGPDIGSDHFPLAVRIGTR